MQCTNCGRNIPDVAKMCPFCEATVEPEPTQDEKQAALDILEQLPPDVRQHMADAFRRSATADEFVNRLFIGNCPKCGSENTGDCENDPEIEEILLGRCYDCGQFWCSMCDRLLEAGHLHCACWDKEEEDDVMVDYT